jgi:predicted nucleic acid-binding protein
MTPLQAAFTLRSGSTHPYVRIALDCRSQPAPSGRRQSLLLPCLSLRPVCRSEPVRGISPALRNAKDHAVDRLLIHRPRYDPSRLTRNTAARAPGIKIAAHRRALGRPISHADAQIAAIAQVRGVKLATRRRCSRICGGESIQNRSDSTAFKQQPATGSTPISYGQQNSTNLNKGWNLVRDQGVGGSNPLSPTNFS